MIDSILTQFGDIFGNANALMVYSEQSFILGPISTFFGWICNFIFNMFYAIFTSGNGTLGLTIILFTLVTKIILFPLTIKQQKSTFEMKLIQPELNKIKTKYKGMKDQDSQRKMSVEMTELQRKHGVNPYAGCLPLLIQLPIIMALFYVVREAYLYIDVLGNVYNDISNKIFEIPDLSSVFNEVKGNISIIETTMKAHPQFDLDTFGNAQYIFSKFSTENWDLFLSKIPTNFVNDLKPLLDTKNNIEHFFTINLVENPTLLSFSVIIPILSAGSSFLFSFITNKQSGNTDDPAMQKQQKIMLYTMPAVMGVMSLTLPAGLGLYWTFSNIFQIITQMIIMRFFKFDKKTKSKEAV